ncbi:lipopolysaccharide biosynthesis protein [Nocardioides sp. zg-ZUI104]|uniref:lipopolysaccharide biosynthesis protein n=1 Tax=Nocardioides faecalis TaxID=2803858 RepID=UPI001BCDFD60|nr:lipopolysaccharide biosynthesis protein [Nocardioides faecalis]MBS4753305.1 lipopolysaccharide biosynthesis protein [Nocardioides faecalis]
MSTRGTTKQSQSAAAVRSGTVTLIGQGARIVLQLAGLVVLSRLLDPVSFGIVAIAQVVITLGEVLRDLGLTTAAIQADSLSHKQHSNLLWTSLAVATFLAAAGIAAAPLLESSFNQPGLGAVTAALLPLFYLNAAQSAFQIDLIRSGRFGSLVACDVVAQFAGLAVCCVGAAIGWEHWALVAQALTIGLMTLVLKASVSRWRPVRPSRGAGTRPLLRYGVHLSGAQLLSMASSNVDTIALGYTSTTLEVGLYNRGYQLLAAPVAQLLTPLSNVAVPALARMRDDKTQFLSYLHRTQSAIGIPMAWLFAVSAALAAPIVRVALGDEWGRTAEILQILSIGGLFQQFSFVSFWAFLSLGLTRDLLRYNFVTKIATIAAIICCAPLGVEGVAWAVTSSLAVSWLVNLLWLSRVAGLPARQFLVSGTRIALIACASASIALIVYSQLGSLPMILALILAVTASALAHLAILLIIRPTREVLGALALKLVPRKTSRARHA